MPNIVGAAGGAALLLAARTGWDVPPPVVLTRSSEFLQRDWDGCSYYNASHQIDGAICSHFSIGRLPSWVLESSLQRATECALEAETDCILSSEVGLAVPTAFVYDEESEGGLLAVVAPRVMTATGPQRMALQDPSSGERLPFSTTFYDSIHIEFLNTRGRAETRLLTGSSSMCVQLLRHSHVEACWQSLE